MKKKILALIISIIAVIACFIGCSNTSASASDTSGFENVYGSWSRSPYVRIVVDKETGVEYILSSNGGISPLYNSDGTLKVKTNG